MSEIEIGGVIFAADEEGLTLSRAGQPGALHLDPGAVSELLDFLRSARVNELNRRRGFRVPVVSGNLRVLLRGPFGQIEAPARDVSLSGIFVELDRHRMPDLHVQDSVELRMTLGDEDIILGGTVRRRTEEGFGIVFAHAADTSDPSPPAGLTRIVMFLERDWLAARVRS
ncbi:MAG: PilZ domain-containing protein [Gemmatimonadota bacterium]|nr:PilZ domain-containing protein [Gemmatimonadota bacterium]